MERARVTNVYMGTKHQLEKMPFMVLFF